MKCIVKEKSQFIPTAAPSNSVPITKAKNTNKTKVNHAGRQTGVQNLTTRE